MPQLPTTSPAMGMQRSSFDYSTLDEESAAIAMEAEAAIKDCLGASCVAVGKMLSQAKIGMRHGSFGPWLEAVFGWSDRTAQNYMAAAEWAEGNSEIVAHLPPTAIYSLAAPSTPEPARIRVIEAIKSGEPITAKSVKSIVATAKGEERAAVERERARLKRAKLSPEEEKKEAKKEAAKKREQDKQAAEQQKWVEEREIKRSNGAALAAIILEKLVGNAEAIRLADGGVWGDFGGLIIEGLTAVREP